jgi:hypothetical protein
MTDMADDIFNPETELASRKTRIPCEVYSRVCGYYRPVDCFNPGKKAEFEERVPFSVPKDIR